ncbi:hypothetical protein AB0M22_31135 [Nocardia sp. NPDC051756]|uniref:hypothetical protein n=1 Tax=Nocardia sp. NPDC051756 TaxID=3154751 RepID=UPI0034343759
MNESSVITLYEYQLAMLHPMCDSAPASAEALLRTLGVTRADTAAAEQRRQAHRITSIAEFITGWGAPDSTNIDYHGGREFRYARWDLSFWPGLQVELTEIPHARILFRRFVRHPQHPRPRLESLSDLTPWSCTHSELSDSGFAPLDHVDGIGAIGDVSAFSAIDPATGQRGDYWAYFDWSLLQGVELRATGI